MACWFATMRRNASARTTGAEVVGFTGVSGARQAAAGCDGRRYTLGFSGESGRQFFRQVRGNWRAVPTTRRYSRVTAHTLGGHEIEGFAAAVVDDPVGEDLAVVVTHRLEAKDCADGQVEIVVAVKGKFNVHDPVIPAVPEDWQGKG